MSPKQESFIQSLISERDWDAIEDGAALRERLLKTVDDTTVGVSAKQASAIISWLLEQPKQERQVQRSRADYSDLPDVPEGRYAVEMDGTLHFFKVRRPDEGKWQGYTFVDEQAGPQTYPVRGQRVRTVLALIAEDTHAALVRYGHELGHCGMCGLELTDEESRARGIGPVCAGKLAALEV